MSTVPAVRSFALRSILSLKRAEWMGHRLFAAKTDLLGFSHCKPIDKRSKTAEERMPPERAEAPDA